MSVNTFLLFLLVVAAYINLYLTHKKLKRNKKGTKLPMTSKQWSDKIQDDSFRAWLKNKENLNK